VTVRSAHSLASSSTSQSTS